MKVLSSKYMKVLSSRYMKVLSSMCMEVYIPFCPTVWRCRDERSTCAIYFESPAGVGLSESQ